MRLVGDDPEVVHHPGLGRGAWVVRASDGRSAVATESSPVASALARAAGDRSVGPAVLATVDGWLLAEHLDGPPMTALELRRPVVLREVAALLAVWHSTPLAALQVAAPVADLAASLRRYRQVAVDVDPSVHPDVAWAEAALGRLRSVDAVPVLCHLDVAANLIATPSGVRLIDFDFAAVASPEQELGQLIWEAELDHAASERLVAFYVEARPVAEGVSVAAAATWCVAVGVAWTLWATAVGGPTMRRYARRSRERLASHWARSWSSDCG